MQADLRGTNKNTKFLEIIWGGHNNHKKQFLGVCLAETVCRAAWLVMKIQMQDALYSFLSFSIQRPTWDCWDLEERARKWQRSPASGERADIKIIPHPHQIAPLPLPQLWHSQGEMKAGFVDSSSLPFPGHWRGSNKNLLTTPRKFFI